MIYIIFLIIGLFVFDIVTFILLLSYLIIVSVGDNDTLKD